MLNEEIFNAIHEVLRFRKEDDELVELLGHHSCMRNGTPHIALSPKRETKLIGHNVFIDIYYNSKDSEIFGVKNTHMNMTNKEISQMLMKIYDYIINYVKS